MEWLVGCFVLPVVLVALFVRYWDSIEAKLDEVDRLHDAAEAAARAESNRKVWPLPEQEEVIETEEEREERARSQEIEFQHKMEAANRFFAGKARPDDPKI